MNIINTSGRGQTDPNKQQPFTGPSLKFIQDSAKESLASIIIAQIGATYSVTIAYLMWGCVRTGAADAGSGAGAITAGAIFYGGEIYTVPAASYTLASNYAVGTIKVTNPSPDPILLKDGTSVNVHDVRQIVFTAGASGSGTFNFASMVQINVTQNQNQAIGTVAITDNTGGTEYTLATFSAITVAKKYKIEVNLQHSPSSSQGITFNLKVNVNGSTVYFLTFQQPSPGSTYTKLAGLFTTQSLNIGDVVTIIADGTASASGVTTVNKGEAALG